MKLLLLIIGIISTPKKMFNNVQNGKFASESYVMFAICMTFIVLKSFAMPNHSNTFYHDKLIDRIVYIFNIPQVEIFISLLLYFLFIMCVFYLCKIFRINLDFKPFFVSMLSISSIGIVAQLLFTVLKLVVHSNILHIGFYLVWLWCVILSVLAVQRAGNSFYFLTTLSFITPAFFFVYFFGLTVIFPYLAWVSK